MVVVGSSGDLLREKREEGEMSETDDDGLRESRPNLERTFSTLLSLSLNSLHHHHLSPAEPVQAAGQAVVEGQVARGQGGGHAGVGHGRGAPQHVRRRQGDGCPAEGGGQVTEEVGHGSRFKRRAALSRAAAGT